MTQLPPFVFTPENTDEHNRLYFSLIDCHIPKHLCDMVCVDRMSSLAKLAMYGVGRWQTRVCVPNDEFRRWCAVNNHQFIIHRLWGDAVGILVSEETAMMIKLTFDVTGDDIIQEIRYVG